MPYAPAYPSKYVLGMVKLKSLLDAGDPAAIHILPKWSRDDLEDVNLPSVSL